jgi:hypothetical protein
MLKLYLCLKEKRRTQEHKEVKHKKLSQSKKKKVKKYTILPNTKDECIVSHLNDISPRLYRAALSVV